MLLIIETLKTWAPWTIEFFSAIPNTGHALVTLDYKLVMTNISFIYYTTLFFWLTRVLVYFGLTLINLINKKHTTQVTLPKTRQESSLHLKLLLTTSKKNYLALAINTLL